MRGVSTANVGYKLFAAAALCSCAGFAQQFEIGGAIGYGAYRNGTVFGPGSSAQAGIRNRFAAGAVIGEDLYQHFSGEVRYLYQDGHAFVSSGSARTEMQAESHTLTYEFLYHPLRRESRVRPFLAAGVGGKDYMASGPAPFFQPTAALAALVPRDQWQFVSVFGGGVKIRVANRVLVRGDFRDYLTAFPKRQIVPLGKNTARGIFQQFTPLFGVSYCF